MGDRLPRAIDANALKGRDFKYFDLVMAAFVAILLLSNVLGAGSAPVGVSATAGALRKRIQDA